MKIDQSLFKDIVSRFPTGVTIITTKINDILFGFTANSFASVSLNPPLILFCISKSSGSYEAFMTTESFAVNFLKNDQEKIAKHFASRIFNKFEKIEYEITEQDNVALKESLGYIELNKYAVYDGGDHSIIVGEVMGGEIDKHSLPLQYLDRNFATAKTKLS